MASHDLDEQGARQVTLVERNGSVKLLVVSPESDLILYGLKKDDETGEYELDLDSDPVELQVRNSELKEEGRSKSTSLNYLDSISHVSVSPNGRFVSASRFSGVIDLYDITNAFDSPEKLTKSDDDDESDSLVIEGIILGKFSGLPTALSFTTRDTLVIVTAEVRVFEYSIIADAADNSISENPSIAAQLTPWSRTNSSLVPQELTEA